MERAIEIIRELFTIVLWLSGVVNWYFGEYTGATLSAVLLGVLELEKINANLEK
jgi:hypothetical protein